MVNYLLLTIITIRFSYAYWAVIFPLTPWKSISHEIWCYNIIKCGDIMCRFSWNDVYVSGLEYYWNQFLKLSNCV